MSDMHGMAKQQVLQELMDMMDKMSASKLKGAGPAKMEVDMTAIPADAADKPVDLMSALKGEESKSGDGESPMEEKQEDGSELSPGVGEEMHAPQHDHGSDSEEDPHVLEELLRKYESLGK